MTQLNVSTISSRSRTTVKNQAHLKKMHLLIKNLWSYFWILDVFCNRFWSMSIRLDEWFGLQTSENHFKRWRRHLWHWPTPFRRMGFTVNYHKTKYMVSGHQTTEYVFPRLKLSKKPSLSHEWEKKMPWDRKDLEVGSFLLHSFFSSSLILSFVKT